MTFQKGHKPVAGFKPGVSGNPAGRPPKRSISDNELRQIARQEGEASIMALVRVRDDPKTSPGVVITAACTLLDRGFGPVKAVDSQTPEPAVPSGVVESPRPFSTTAEWQASANAWVEKQRQAPNDDPAKKH